MEGSEFQVDLRFLKLKIYDMVLRCRLVECLFSYYVWLHLYEIIIQKGWKNNWTKKNYKKKLNCIWL